MTAQELLQVNVRLLEIMQRNKMEVGDIRHLEMCEEYDRMRRKGIKITFIVASLAQRYGIHERTVYKVIRSMAKKIDLGCNNI